jgi:5-formyltetrahydrofolate cyclo-ligase
MQIADARTLCRKSIRQERNQIPHAVQERAGEQLVGQCTKLPELKAGHHIAVYLSVDGELNTTPLIHWLWQTGKSVYLPVIHPFSSGHLLFLRYENQTPMRFNQYGIREPILDQRGVIPTQTLDIIFTPLVGFDTLGHRLGMGGGYYDRTLAQWFQTGDGAKPIGLAHDCQQVERLPIESWDIPLPKIVTPSRVWCWE